MGSFVIFPVVEHVWGNISTFVGRRGYSCIFMLTVMAKPPILEVIYPPIKSSKPKYKNGYKDQIELI